MKNYFWSKLKQIAFMVDAETEMMREKNFIHLEARKSKFLF